MLAPTRCLQMSEHAGRQRLASPSIAALHDLSQPFIETQDDGTP